MFAHKKFPFIGALTPAIAAATLGFGIEAQARVASIVIDSPAVPAFAGAAIGTAGSYVTLKGRVFGELDPHDQHNTIIQDLELAPKDSHGMVHYIATFQITMPADLSKASGLMFNEVSNRGGNAIPSTAAAVVPGAIYLQSGWQGDLLAHCTTDYPCTPLNVPFTGTQQVIQVPVAKNKDGSTIVTNAANEAVKRRFLRSTAATALIAQAQAGNVLTDITPTDEDQEIAKRLCSPH